MAITGINNSSYTSYYASNYKNTVKKTDSEKDSTNTKDGNVTTSTVELKTSRPGVTKTEQIKTGYSNVNDYSKYLQGKYHYMNIGLTSMQGIPTTVSVSSAFLQKCMNDPEKAKYLEENLAAIPDCTKDTINGCLGTVTNQSYMIDANGNIIETASGTNDPDGKIAKENAERKAKENREKEEKIKEKQEEMVALIAENAKTGSYTPEFDERYRIIAEEINALKEAQKTARNEKRMADSYEQRIQDIDHYLSTSTCQIPEFDNDLVRRLISTIKVESSEKLLIQFQSGIVMEQEIRYE